MLPVTAPVNDHRQLVRPLILAGQRGPILGVYYPPIDGVEPKGDLLVVPAFAEELNRCRSMVAMQARQLSLLGCGVLVIDPYGTGDSDGDFSEATWAQWRQDFRLGIAWLRSFGNGCCGLWGIRLGALMAIELAAEDSEITRLLLWQPVVNAKTYFTQFLRIRVAADIERRDGVRSVDELRRQTESGQLIDVSGYSIGPILAKELDSLKTPALTSIESKSIYWFETLPSAEANVSRESIRVMDEWRAAGIALQLHKVLGSSFWQVHERVTAPDLIHACATVVGAWPSRQSAITPSSDSIIAVTAQFEPVTFKCESESLFGIWHHGSEKSRIGIVMVVAGGPQYRVGAHRQFVSLARDLADRGHNILRFDLRGMGDSSGVHQGFLHSETDIKAAIDCLQSRQPELTDFVLIGECESASGILFYAYKDARVRRVVLVNPWVRTAAVQAEVIIKHYYWERLVSKDFWGKVRRGEFNPLQAARSLSDVLRTYWRDRNGTRAQGSQIEQENLGTLPLPIGTAIGLQRFPGNALILMSGRDHIAREFDQVVAGSPMWMRLMKDKRVSRHDVADADHTFSRAEWKQEVATVVGNWLETR
jgi:exosortase A-associated hydrolase 1/exosortase A-associated hydrolase 2